MTGNKKRVDGLGKALLRPHESQHRKAGRQPGSLGAVCPCATLKDVLCVWTKYHSCTVYLKGKLRSNTLSCNHREMIYEGNYSTSESLQMRPRGEK